MGLVTLQMCLLCFTFEFILTKGGELVEILDLDDKTKKLIVDQHNKNRREVKPTATNMLYMVWHEELAGAASAHGSHCYFNETSDFNSRGLTFGSVSKYIQVSDSQSDSAITPLVYLTVSSYFSGSYFYSFDSGRCRSQSSGGCDNYLRAVWSNVQFVGCGATRCNNVKWPGKNWDKVTMLTCLYAPAPKSLDGKPYTRGEPCSDCDENQVCNIRLCYESSIRIYRDDGDFSISKYSIPLDFFSMTMFSLALHAFLQYGS